MRPPPAAGPVRQALSRRSVRAVLAVLIAAGVALAALPYAAGYGIRHWLEAHGADRVELADVSLNPFTGHLGVRGLSVIVSGTRVLAVPEGSVRIDWLPLLRRRVQVVSLSLTGARAGFEHRPDGTWLGPLFAAPASAAGPAPARSRAPWAFGVETAVLELGRVDVADGPETHTLAIDRMTLKRLATWAPDAPAHGTFAGSLDGAAVNLEGDLSPFAEAPGATGRVRVTDLALDPFRALSAGPLKDLTGRVSVDAKVTASRSADGMRVTQDGAVILEQATARAAERGAEVGRLAWEGTVKVTRVPAGPPAWEAEGRLEGGPIAVDLTPEDLRVAERRMVWRGKAASGAPDAGPTASGEGMVEGLRVDLPARGMRVLAVQEAAFDGVMLAPSGVLDLGGAHLTGLVVGTPLTDAEHAERPPLMTVSGVQVDAVRRTPGRGIVVAAVRVDGVDAALERTADGRLRLIGDRLERVVAPPAGAGGKEAPPRAVPVFRVDRLSLTGDSRVGFTDRSVEPPFRASVRVREARVEGLDSGHPDTPARVNLALRMGDDTELGLTGSLTVFAPQTGMNLDGTVRRLELAPFSAYAAGALGYHVASGQMDADLRIRSAQGRLAGTSHITLRKLEVTPGDKTAMDRMARELTMPLEGALALLRDRNDTIRMDLPLSGDLENPTVDLSGVIARAVARGLQKGAVQYAKIALQPFGAMVQVVQLAGKAMALRLDPVAFSAGSATVGPVGTDYAAKVAALLAERPQLSLRLCGKAAEADRAALAGDAGPTAAADAPDAPILALARARAEAFRRDLVAAHGVAPERLVICRPELDPAPDARPRVELLI